MLKNLLEEADESTGVANVHLSYVTAEHEAFPHQHRGPMTNKTVSLHLPQTKSSIPRSTLCWLPRQHRTGTTGPRMHLILYHMFQTLIITSSSEIEPLIQ